MREDSRKHLEFIQAVIARMANNSFALKAWSVTVLAGLFALAAGRAGKAIPWIAVLPVLIFWILDAFFLRKERLYRNLYDHVRKLSDKGWEDLGGHRYSLTPTDYGLKAEPLVKAMMRRTLLVLYSALLASVVVFGLLMWAFA